MRRRADQRPQVGTPGRLNLAVKYIRHAGAEHAQPRTSRRDLAVPVQRLAPVRGAGAMARHVGPPNVVAVAGGVPLGVAVVTLGAGLGAAPTWVKGRGTPLDPRAWGY